VRHFPENLRKQLKKPSILPIEDPSWIDLGGIEREDVVKAALAAGWDPLGDSTPEFFRLPSDQVYAIPFSWRDEDDLSAYAVQLSIAKLIEDGAIDSPESLRTGRRTNPVVVFGGENPEEFFAKASDVPGGEILRIMLDWGGTNDPEIFCNNRFPHAAGMDGT